MVWDTRYVYISNVDGISNYTFTVVFFFFFLMNGAGGP